MKGQVIGARLQRVDGRSKVMGAARYTADFNQAHQAHAVIVGAAIGLGRIARIELRANYEASRRIDSHYPSERATPLL